MKILILTQYYPPEVGAPQNRLHELAIRLKRKGAQITVLTAMPNYPEMEIHKTYKGKWHITEYIDNIRVERFWIYANRKRTIIYRLLNYFSFVLTATLGGLSLREKFDFLFCESPPLFLGITAIIIKKVKQSRLIFNVSDLWPASAQQLGIIKNSLLIKIASFLEEFLYLKSYLITGQTKGIISDISRRFPDKKFYWLKNGVDLDFFSLSTKYNNWQKKIGFSEEDFLVLYAGILGYAQGLELILKVAERLIQYNKIKFIIVGDGPERDKLISLKKSLNLNSVFFLGIKSKEKMPHIIKSIDIAIIPLRKLELFKGAIPSKIFENLAMSKPILLGVDGEAKELFIEQGKCGLYYEPENEIDLSEKIIHLYENPKLRKRLGANGFKYVSQNFNRDKITLEFWEFLSKSAN